MIPPASRDRAVGLLSQAADLAALAARDATAGREGDAARVAGLAETAAAAAREELEDLRRAARRA